MTQSVKPVCALTEAIKPLLPPLLVQVADHRVLEGFRKYGQTLSNNHKPLRKKVVHHIQELLDALNYNEAGRLLGYVTRRPLHMRDVTYTWLRTHGFPVASYLLRHMPDEHACKSVQAVGLAVSWGHRDGGPNHLSNITLVEDSGREALSAARNGLRVHLIDQPHNQAAQHERITRIPDLTHLKAELHD